MAGGNGRGLFPKSSEVCPMHSIMETLVDSARNMALVAQRDAASAIAAVRASEASLNLAREEYTKEVTRISTNGQQIINELAAAVADLKKSVAKLNKKKR